MRPARRGRPAWLALTAIWLAIGSGCAYLETTEGGEVVAIEGADHCLDEISSVPRPPDRTIAVWLCRAGRPVAFEAAADPGFVFAGWEGGAPDCGADPICRPASTWTTLKAVFVAQDGPTAAPDQVFLGNDDVLYLSELAPGRVHRYWLARDRWLAPIELGPGVTHVALAPEQARLYLNRGGTGLAWIDLAGDRRESPFVDHDRLLHGLAGAGDFVFAALSGASPYGHALYRSDGSVADLRVTLHYRSDEFTWVPELLRIYYVRSDAKRWDLNFQAYDANGRAISLRESPSEPAFDREGPVRVSASLGLAAVGSGEIHDAGTLQVVGFLPEPFVDAAWFGSELLALVAETDGTTRLRRHAPGGATVDAGVFPGEPVRIFDHAGEVLVVTLVGGRPAFHRFADDRDADDDGASDFDDAFSLDPAASSDRDGDGAPDALDLAANPSSPLVLDAFPDDTACQLAAHAVPGASGVCDVAAAIPQYVPDAVAIDAGGVVHLLSATHARVFRWSLGEARDLDSIATGSDPRAMVYDAAGHRLQLAYHRRPITQIDLAEPSPRETYFGSPLNVAAGLASFDGFLVASSASTYSSERRFAGYGPDGTRLWESRDFTGASRYVWEPVQRRAYFLDTTFDDIEWLGLDEAGAVADTGRSGVLGGTVEEPAAPSPDGRFLRLGTGALYRVDGEQAQYLSTVPGPHADLVWLDGGSWTSIRGDGAGGTLLTLYGPDGSVWNEALFPGAPLRLLRGPDAVAVVTLVAGRPALHRYVPDDDADGDDVGYASDAFPEDPAASVDSDGDGAPDAWNPGFGPAQSTTGLVLDAFPFDSACQLTAHAVPGRPDVCNIRARLIALGVQAGRSAVDAGGVLHVLVNQNRIDRWRLADGTPLNPVWLDAGARQIVYSAAHDRLYVGYDDGTILAVEPDTLAGGVAFAAVPGQEPGLVAAGAFLIASATVDDRFFVFAEDGALVKDFSARYGSRHLAWSEARGRLYHLSDDVSPDDLHAEDLDVTTGAHLASVESPHHAELPVWHPIWVSPDGSRVLLGPGDLYDGGTLSWRSSLPVTDVDDAAWLEDGTLLTLRADGGAQLERWDAASRRIDGARYDGSPLRIVPHEGALVLVTLGGGTLAFHSYVPGSDGDQDTVPFPVDDLPFDTAASLDSDGDGAPDAFHPGHGTWNSDLERDAFPFDSACQRANQAIPGVPGACNVAAQTPAYEPDAILQDARGVLHLLDGARGVVRRHDFTTGTLNPIVADGAATHFAYSLDDDRLYLGYATGEITTIDPLAPADEATLAVLPNWVLSLQTVGPWIHAVDGFEDGTHFVFGADGTLASRQDDVGSVAVHADFSPVTGRLHHFDFYHHWIAFDLATGATGASVTGAPHAPRAAPVRVSPDGSVVLDGLGQLLDAATYAFVAQVLLPFTDAAFTDEGGVSLRSDGAGESWLERWDPDFRILERVSLPGQPLRVFPWDGGFHAVTQLGGRPAFHRHVPDGDGDHDGTADTADAFPLDAAAAVDSDEDGAPDAWNPGRGAADSTTGLELDAFPADFGCQLEEHGRDGACDVASVLPDDPATPLCDFHDPPPAGAGSTVVGDVVDFSGLCSGWLLTAERNPDRLVVRQVIRERIGAVFELPGDPGEILLDAERKRAFVTVPALRLVVEVDLVAGASRNIPTPYYIGPITLGNDGRLLMRFDSTLYWLEDGDDSFSQSYLFGRGELAYNRARDEVVTVDYDLVRHAFDPAVGASYLQHRRSTGGVRAEGLAISADGAHVYRIDRSPYVEDVAAGDLTIMHGRHNLGSATSGVDLALSSDDTTLVWGGRNEMIAVETGTFAEVGRLALPYCGSGVVERVGVSTGADIVFAGQRCFGYPVHPIHIHWLPLD